MILLILTTTYFVKLYFNEQDCLKKNFIWLNDEHSCIDIGYGKTKAEMDIQIIGDALFKEQITKALYLLQYKSPDTFEYPKKYIKIIKQVKNGYSGMKAWIEKPTFLMSNSSAFYSLTWAASSIVHDSYHSYLYHTYKQNNPNKKVPYKVLWAEQEAELKCNMLAVQSLEDMHAPNHEIVHVKSGDGKHGDLNGDGKYNTKEDKKLRAERINSRNIKSTQKDKTNL